MTYAELEQYFLSLAGNGQLALAIFLVVFAVLFFVGAYRKRASIARARAKLPLSIGGWGTRGKSGTERLKAALFHGLGYEVTVKTTGCEAMLIHSVPDQPPHEIFIFRSYDKATIWEQRDTVEHAAALGSEVFLWECMALQPEFVRLLQQDWMRDDYVTLTNAFPDHEDVQGPTGADVAECISAFIPKGSQLLTSEQEFLPLFRQRAEERDTQIDALGPHDGDLIASDVLALFPYNEHPRNIALAAKLADHLGIDRDLSIATMAEHVVPDLGVLKTYPAAVVRGRTLSFINGMSANERTGFLNNWNRMALGAKDVESMPHETIVTVVNNRWDRVARSEVFARIVVEDAVADAHVLIGTNLRGLRRYIDEALRRYCAAIEIAIDTDREGAALGRLATLMARQRVPIPAPERIIERVEIYAAASGHAVDRSHLMALAARALASSEELSLVAIRGELTDLFETLKFVPGPTAPGPEVCEIADDVREHCVRQASRIALHARLAAMIDNPAINERVRVAYHELFMDQLVVVEDQNESGDQIIDRCARAVPPGTRVSVMGIQNIKGTGLDFVYRWLALDTTMLRLARLDGEDREARLQSLRELDGFEDYGMVDSGIAAQALAAYAQRGLDDDELVYVQSALERVRSIHEDRKRALAQASTKDVRARLISGIETLLDPLDSVRRRSRASAIMQDLIDHRISHGRAAKEMRALYDRQGGGWLRPTPTTLA
ncbi:MAG: poly-gamma-glutamate synthase PgsB [Myxococcota bacterium]|nr:poly-gamma-glutamate synthase PgsB [Deltaproteobacteria bacterium]MDQ3338197.1 poly-gamma-glutamate synthase PgsB [Myxococcota bacterium]